MTRTKIEEWVKLGVQDQDLVEYKIQIEGKTNKDDGYIGNIDFVTVNGTTSEGNEKSLNFVIKSSKESEALRKQVPVKGCFEKEIYIYQQVKPAFDAFQKSQNIENLLDFLPHCYASQETGTSELIILKNLRVDGYTLCDRKKPMSFDHLRLILQAYGRWHAFSLALKQHKPTVFEKLTENNQNALSGMILQGQVDKIIFELFESAKNKRLQTDKKEILEKLQFSKNDIKHSLIDLLFEDPSDHVIFHGDSWTNNFMFLQTNSEKPLSVKILDWQGSGLSSPVIDLSYLIYSCCNNKMYKDVEIWLRIYYESLSSTSKTLGIDINNVFSYEKLLLHWKKFSKFGFFVSVIILRLSLCEADDAPDFTEAAEQGKEFITSLNFEVKDEAEYLERIEDNFLHYVNNL